MVDLKQLQASLQTSSRPPVETWNPPFCGDLDIRIAADGRWFYQGSEITRQPLVRLFASVLWQENDEYYLVTPGEKVRIKVDDLPFCILSWAHVGDNNEYIKVTTNVGEEYVLSAENPLCMEQTLPAVKIRDGFLARVHRNVYYQWAELAEPARDNNNEASGYYIQSGATRFWLGPQA